MAISQAQPSIVLASGSPRRKDLLQELGLAFRVEVSGVSEQVTDPVSPAKYVETLAERKARDVASRVGHENVLVIGSDTVVVMDGEILGKPHDEQHAFNMLHRLQGRTHEVFTGVSVIACSSDIARTAHSSTRVTMRAITDDTIHRYIATREPMDKAGAYAIQGLGSTLVSHIEGDYFTVVGLPLALLSTLLADFGVHVL